MTFETNDNYSIRFKISNNSSTIRFDSIRDEKTIRTTLFFDYVCLNVVDLNLEQQGSERLVSRSCSSPGVQGSPTVGLGANAAEFVRNPMTSEINAAGSDPVRSTLAGMSPQLSYRSLHCAGSLHGAGSLHDADVSPVPTVSSLECSWVTQQHSAASYPDCWSQPVKLLTEFCQTEDYKSSLAAASDDTPSDFCDGTVISVVQSTLPTSLKLKCSAPHLHRWNPSMSADFTDFFHDRIKVLSTAGTVYRYDVQLSTAAGCSHSSRIHFSRFFFENPKKTRIFTFF